MKFLKALHAYVRVCVCVYVNVHGFKMVFSTRILPTEAQHSLVYALHKLTTLFFLRNWQLTYNEHMQHIMPIMP